jgi:hypothetical protein
MMKKINEIENKLDKKEWLAPSFQIIAFKDTNSGYHESTTEDLKYFDPAS